MAPNKAARRSCTYHRANGSVRTRSILADDDQMMLVGLLIGVSFGLMLFIGVMLGW